ncbi:hypothetical protein ACF0H5_014905 [Mactra antiquata]
MKTEGIFNVSGNVGYCGFNQALTEKKPLLIVDKETVSLLQDTSKCNILVGIILFNGGIMSGYCLAWTSVS